MIKKFPVDAGDVRDGGSVPGSGRSPGGGHGNRLQCSWASLMAQRIKNLPAVGETRVQSLGWEKGSDAHTSVRKPHPQRSLCPSLHLKSTSKCKPQFTSAGPNLVNVCVCRFVSASQPPPLPAVKDVSSVRSGASVIPMITVLTKQALNQCSPNGYIGLLCSACSAVICGHDLGPSRF